MKNCKGGEGCKDEKLRKLQVKSCKGEKGCKDEKLRKLQVESCESDEGCKDEKLRKLPTVAKAPKATEMKSWGSLR